MTEFKTRNHYFKFRAHTADDHQSRAKGESVATDFYNRFSNSSTGAPEQKRSGGFNNSFDKYRLGVIQQSEVNFYDDLQNGCLPQIEKHSAQNSRKIVINKNSSKEYAKSFNPTELSSVTDGGLQPLKSKILISDMFNEKNSCILNRRFSENRPNESYYVKFK